MAARYALIALVATARPAHAHAVTTTEPVDLAQHTATAMSIAASYQTRTALLRDAAGQMMVPADQGPASIRDRHTPRPSASLTAWLRDVCPVLR